ncbi:MAG: hypothetical protein HOI07_09990 [Betaproteobacteria bacterium]|nr:hypothetical protein [Betaproteobacteria bacterium]
MTGYDSENKVLYSVISKSSYFEEQDAGFDMLRDVEWIKTGLDALRLGIKRSCELEKALSGGD